MSDLNVLVLTDDELTCLAESTKRPWALPLGIDRDPAEVRATALAGERSLFARGLVGLRDDKYALSAAAFDHLRPGLTGEPRLALFIVDGGSRLVLEGMSIAWYRQDGEDVMEARAANGLHHFTRPVRDDLVRALCSYITVAYEEGFPGAIPEVSLALCVIAPERGRAFRVTKNSVSATEITGQTPATDWADSSLADALALVRSL